MSVSGTNAKNAPRNTWKGGKTEIKTYDTSKSNRVGAKPTRRKRKNNWYNPAFDGAVCFKKANGEYVSFGATKSRSSGSEACKI